MRKIAVLGSINIDYFVKLEEFPQIGETITAQQLDLLYGGKGANQAVSAGKLNGDVTFFGSVGDDAIGDDILANFKEHGIKTKYVQRVSNVNTGSAFVLSNSEDNQIIVIEGANKYTNIEYVESHLEQILEHDIFLLQVEIPMETIESIVPIVA